MIQHTNPLWSAILLIRNQSDKYVQMNLALCFQVLNRDR